MNNLISELQELRIEQSTLIHKISVLDKRIKCLENQVHGQKVAQPKSERTEKTDIQTGDTIVLLTKGACCRKGDKAKVTKISDFPYANTVYFTVLHNGNNTYKKRSNVKKV